MCPGSGIVSYDMYVSAQAVELFHMYVCVCVCAQAVNLCFQVDISIGLGQC